MNEIKPLSPMDKGVKIYEFHLVGKLRDYKAKVRDVPNGHTIEIIPEVEGKQRIFKITREGLIWVVYIVVNGRAYSSRYYVDHYNFGTQKKSYEWVFSIVEKIENNNLFDIKN
jgi:hypothetical protein